MGIEFTTLETQQANEENIINCSKNPLSDNCSPEGIGPNELSFTNTFTLGYDTNERKRITLNNTTFIVYDVGGIPGGTSYVANRNSKIYHFSAGDEQLTEQILSTFRFTTDTSVSPTPSPKATITPTSLKVLYPNGGEHFTVGNTVAIRWSLPQALAKNGYWVGLFLTEGPTPGNVGLVQVTSANGQYQWRINDYIIQGDVGMQLQRGNYKMHLLVYDNKPCLGLCPPEVPRAKVLGQDVSNSTFRIDTQ